MAATEFKYFVLDPLLLESKTGFKSLWMIYYKFTVILLDLSGINCII